VSKFITVFRSVFLLAYARVEALQEFDALLHMRLVVDSRLDLDEQFDLLLDAGNLMLKVDVLHFHHATEGFLEQADVVIAFEVLLNRLFDHCDGVDF
jgi:hypothetical protein